MDDYIVSNDRPVYSNPKYIGGYQIGGKYGLRIMFEQKPKWIHRKMMKWCLGWEWVDADI